MGSESNLANHFATIMNRGPHERIEDILGLDKKYEDKFADLIPKALEAIRNEAEELAEANKIFEDLKAKYTRNQATKNKNMLEYRGRLSPYSTGSSTPMRSPPIAHPAASHALSSIQSKTCTICEKLFANRQSLRRHIERKHPDQANDGGLMPPPPVSSKDDLPFKCPDCAKRFEKLDVLAQHQKRHRPKTMECPHCHRRYAFKNEFRKHLTRVHKIDSSEIPDDLTEYGKLTVEGVIHEKSTVGRPKKTPVKAQIDDNKENPEDDDDDESLDDMLLQHMASTSEITPKMSPKEVFKNTDEGNDKDLDPISLQQTGNPEIKIQQLEDLSEEDDDDDLDDIILKKMENNIEESKVEEDSDDEDEAMLLQQLKS